MQVLLLLLPLLLPAIILIIVRHAIVRASKPVFIKDLTTAHNHQLLVRGNRMSSASPSTIVTRGRYHNIISSPASGELWRTFRHNLSSGVVHPTHLHRYAAARRQAVRGLVADLREQRRLTDDGVAVAAAESIRDALFGVAATMCFGYGVDAGVVRAMSDVHTKLVMSLSALGTFKPGPLLAVSRLIYRERWNKSAVIRRKQEELYLPLIDACRCRRHGGGDSGETPSYVHTLLDLHVPVESEADGGHNSGGKQGQRRRKLVDGELVGLCSEFLGQVSESTAAAVQWIMARLIKHRDIQEAIREEINAAVDACAEEVPEEVLGKLDQLNAVTMEALRLHPPIMWVFRQVMEEDQVVHDGQRIPTGTDVIFLLEALGRDKRAWDDPDEFKPERFHGCGGGEKSTTKNLLLSMAAEMKMIPFGVGKRMCPAISVSLLHIGYFVANLVREFVWEEAEGEQDAVQLQTDTSIVIFNRIKRPLRARLVPARPEEAKKSMI